MNSPTPPYEQQTQGRRKVECMSPSDGQREHADQAEGAEPRGGDNDQRLMPKDPGRACPAELEEKSDFQKLLIELEQERLGSSIIESAFYPAPLTVPARDAEWRAWELLRFASLLPSAPFDEELAASGWYSAVYRHHSDRGLAEIEAKEKPPSSELAAFKRLEEMGVYDQTVFYSPAKAQQSHYTNELDRILGTQSAKRAIAPDGRRTLSARELLDQAGRGATGNGSSATGSSEPEGFGSSARAAGGSQGICDPHAW